MLAFTNNLEREVDKKIKKIMSADVSIIKKSYDASELLVNAFSQLRNFIVHYSFKDSAEEIYFFKNIKPKIFHKLLYYRKIYNIEMNRPLGIDAQRAYLIDEMNAISRYNEKRSDFIRYYRSNLTLYDELYYLRGKADLTLFLESCYYERDPIFSTNCDVEKKDSIKTLLLTLWKSDDDRVTKTESGELGSAVECYIERICADRSITPCFNTFYEYLLHDYRQELESRDIKVHREDFNIDNMLTTLRQYYRGGRYDFLLNSEENIDLLSKRFIVFEIDSIKENKELFPVVTIIIMEAFINKMRRLKGVRKQLIVEEAWKALSTANMAEYLKYMYKTVRKYFGEAIVVTQEVDDIISSPVVKEAIINNSDCKILLDQRKFMNRFDAIQSLLGLTDKERAQILSINMSNHPGRRYKEVWIGLGGVQSAVYATEVSHEEYLTYTTEETEKMQVQQLTATLGRDMELAIKYLAQND